MQSLHTTQIGISTTGDLPQCGCTVTDFTPLSLSSQPYGDVLYVNIQAPSNHLFEAANQRMAALGDLLRILESGNGNNVLPQESARLASALGLLLADAQALHEAAYHRARADEVLARSQHPPVVSTPFDTPA
ncbi:hypothetical protein [Pseudomonas sp. OTU5201]|uniref:hypothetical protein n=1 Tax=Pseudomonas sp. OTU5201 TaxID=3043850 RepID=UPI00313EACAA